MTVSDEIAAYIAQWSLDEVVSADFLRHLRLQKLPPNATLSRGDGIFGTLYFLVKGSVRVSYDHLNGKQSIVGTVEPMALIGELDLFYEPDLQLVLVTNEESHFLTIDREMALRLGRDDPRFLRLIIVNLSAKLTDSTVIVKHNILPLMGQVCAFLLTKSDASGTVTILSKAYLAELMGTTPRHLNRVLNELTDEGVIAIDGTQIRVTNAPRLAELAAA